MATFLSVKGIGKDVFDAIVRLEHDCYPLDEAASRDQLEMRRAQAPEYFFVAVSNDETLAANDYFPVAGFVNGTCCKDTGKLEENSMSSHVPGGSVLCIHSVVVAPGLRRRGIARRILRQYLRRIALEQPHVNTVLLLSKIALVPFYASSGFIDLGASAVDHGKETWNLMSMSLKTTSVACVNAFRVPNRSFSGNPAAVCILPSSGIRSLRDSKRSDIPLFKDESLIENSFDQWSKKISNQLNLSETAFLRPLELSSNSRELRFELRWYTPAEYEIDLCGHATLASAIIIWNLPESGFSRNGTLFDVDNIEKLVFETKSGELVARRVYEDDSIKVILDFPCYEVHSKLPASINRSDLLKAVRVDDSQVGYIGTDGMGKILIEVISSDIVKALDPNFEAMNSLDAIGIMVTSRYSQEIEGFDFASRSFFPKLGVNEDPFTGSNHCLLGPYWSKKLNKTKLKAIQLSARQGVCELNLESEGRVHLAGYGEISWKGELLSSPLAYLMRPSTNLNERL